MFVRFLVIFNSLCHFIFSLYILGTLSLPLEIIYAYTLKSVIFAVSYNDVLEMVVLVHVVFVIKEHFSIFNGVIYYM